MPSSSGVWYLDWFKKAGEDELSIRAILKEGSPSTACFLSQQMTEKLLKGLLVFYKKEFPKLHDLLKLKDLFLDIAPGINQLNSNLKLLNRYYTEARYPGDQEEFSKQDAEEAFEAAMRVKDFVLERVSSK